MTDLHSKGITLRVEHKVHEKDTQTAYKHVNKCSISLVIKEMYIKIMR